MRVAFASHASALGQAEAVFPPAEVRALPSGTRLVLRPSRANEIVALKIYLPMGPLYEGRRESGLSNLLQEMLLHGTRRRSEEEFQDALADLGAKLDTSAANDHGSITLRVARSEMAGALDLLEELLVEPALDPEELVKEKVRVLNRIKAQNDSLLTAAFELFRETFYQEHPYHKPILGYPDTVRDVDLADLQAARARFYQPQSLVVSAVGNFEADDLARRLERIDLPRQDGTRPALPSGEVKLERTRHVAKRRESLAAWFVLGFPAPSYRDPGYAAARLVDAILGSTMNSRLFVQLREKRSLAYQVAAYYNDQLSHSFMAGYIGTSPHKFDEAREAMLTEFRRIAEERIPEAELDRAKSYLQGSYIVRAETNGAQGARLGKYELYGLGQDFGNGLLERIAAVTPEEIRALGERYFGTYVLAAIRPDEASLERLEAQGQPADLFERTRVDANEEEGE